MICQKILGQKWHKFWRNFFSKPHLGKVAEATENRDDAKNYYLQALQIFVEFNDEYGLSICLPNIKRFYQETQDDSILEAVASLLNKTVEEVREGFNNG